MGDIEVKDLARFLGKEGAQGQVFFKHGEYNPFLQLHVFPTSYTLFWPSDSSQPHFLSAVDQLFQEASSIAWQRVDDLGDPVRYVSLSALLPEPNGLMEEYTEISIEGMGSIQDVSGQVEDFLLPIWHQVVSLYGFLSPYPRPSLSVPPFMSEPLFSFWSDTANTPVAAKETGITCSLRVPFPHVLIHVILMTSPSLTEDFYEVLQHLLQRIEEWYHIGRKPLY